MEFVPGGGGPDSWVPGESIEGGKYIGLVRMWAGDRRVDWKLREKDNELEDKREFYFNGEQFSSDDWGSSWGRWDGTIININGTKHSLKSYIELHMEQGSYDDINDIWCQKYEEHY